MTDEEKLAEEKAKKKAKTKEYGDRYTAKDPERRRRQKREAQARYFAKNKAKCIAKTKECDAKRRAKDPKAFKEKNRIYADNLRRKQGIPKAVRLTEEERKAKAYAASRRWVKENIEYSKQYMREWARNDKEQNPEKYEESQRRRKENQTEEQKLRAKETRRRNNRKHKHERLRIEEQDRWRVGEIDWVAYDKTLELFDFKCVYCREPATTVDHIVAIKRGGTNHHTNLIPACSSCNSSKWKHDLGVWLQKPRAKRVLARPWDWKPEGDLS